MDDQSDESDDLHSESEIESSHEHRGTRERVQNHSAVSRALSHRRDHGVSPTSGGSYPAIEDPLPGIDEQVTVEVLQEVMQRQWIGPMADPETLAQYDAIVPGMAERLLRVHESQTVQVSNREDAIVGNRHRIDVRGQLWAGLLAAFCVLAAIPMLALGNIAGGSIILGMPLLVLIGSFLPGRSPRPDKPEE